VANRDKRPPDWEPDIQRSVADYNDWYLKESPGMWAESRGKAVSDAAEAMAVTNDFRDVTPAALRARPGALFVARMAVSPTMARDRFVGFSRVNKNLVTTMERDGAFPQRMRGLDAELQRMCSFISPLLDPGLFPWVADNRRPTPDERDRALLVLGERLAAAIYLPTLRNAQEARQKVEMRAFLQKHGFKESTATAFQLPPGTFGFGRNVPVTRPDGQPQNLPVDCVVKPKTARLPLACVELKSAGDFTNVNKRRKEESDKHEALRRTHGSKVVFLLQLFGYFDRGYLGFEASAGIDWAWDHRLADFLPYLGVP
jgi:hypothetical protein